jgi:small GTP-binding protein
MFVFRARQNVQVWHFRPCRKYLLLILFLLSFLGEGFDVVKYGDARIALIGFPSVGKSTGSQISQFLFSILADLKGFVQTDFVDAALALLTGTESEAAAYEFTTLTCIPGIIHFKGTKIQLLDLPGIIEGAAQGKGRGRQVIAVAKSADLVLMMLDATKPDAHKAVLEAELESTGIRLNKQPADIYFRRKKTGSRPSRLREGGPAGSRTLLSWLCLHRLI